MTPEEKARIKIDQWFADAGWKVVNREDYEPTCTAVAIREGLLKGNLEADYFLFINGKAVGVLEAKREETDAFASKVCDQATLYARSVPNIYQAYQKPLPFIFTSNGKELYFCDFREKDAYFKQIMTIPAPHELVKNLGIEDAFAGLPTLKRKGLRDCQYEAVTALEKSFRSGQNRALMVLATGVGKTYTACLAAYRMLSYTPMRKVLFLVDRNNLGLHAGVVGVGLAAHGAFVHIAPCLLGLALGGLEVHRLPGALVLGAADIAPHVAADVAPEKEEVVQNGHHGQQHGEVKAAGGHPDQLREEESRVRPGQPLGLHGEEEEQQELHVGIEGGEGEEHGEVHIVHGGGARREAHQNVGQHAHQVKEGELGRAPLPLQGGADEIDEIKLQRQKDQIVLGRHKDKSDQPPDLPLEDLRGGERQQLGKGHGAELVKEKDDEIAKNDIEHQPGNAQPGVLVGEPVQPRVYASQSY